MKLKEIAAEYAGKIRNEKISEMFIKCFMSTYETTVQLDGDGDCFVITGDIPAMWLRDSSAQVNHYVPFAKASTEAYEVIDGLIRRQIGCILADPYANAFNREANGLGHRKDKTEQSPYVWERKYEIDSLCYPVRLAYSFWKSAGATSHFTQEMHEALYKITDVWTVEQKHAEASPYYFRRPFSKKTDTLSHKGKGAPVGYTGMTWSGFRPSDDSCKYGYLIPANMFASVVLGYIAEIAENIYNDSTLKQKALKLREKIDEGIEKFAVVRDGEKEIYAYETDGLGNYNLMDDANVPSLLSLPYLGFCAADDERYINTRRFILSDKNPYYFDGKTAKGIGSPHTPKNHIWPIALCMQGLTSQSSDEIRQLIHLLSVTDADTGFMHESFHKDKPSKFTREWFSWANTLFAELVMKYIDENGELE